jgi:cysteine synthase
MKRPTVARGAFGLAGVLLLGSGGVVCNTPDPPVREVRPGIVVLVLDADTNDPVEDATVTVTNSDTMEVLTLMTNELGFAVGISTVGTYSVSIQREEYEPAAIEDIKILAGRYAYQDFIPVDVVVYLTRAASGPAANTPLLSDGARGL